MKTDETFRTFQRNGVKVHEQKRPSDRGERGIQGENGRDRPAGRNQTSFTGSDTRVPSSKQVDVEVQKSSVALFSRQSKATAFIWGKKLRLSDQMKC